MLQLMPGQQMNLKHNENRSCVPGMLTGIDDKKLTLLLSETIKLQPGDELELEIPQAEDALYILPCSYLETVTSRTCIIKTLGEANRRQRRSSTRIPTNLKAKYTVLSGSSLKKGSSEGEILNISSEGALVSVNKPLKINSDIMLTFEIRMGLAKAFTTSIVSKVVRSHDNRTPGKILYGVAFKRSFNLINNPI